jgi:GDP/UDP-N,N'-diacetylbacillosamine 2-epimerase (hydrolysing)
MSVRNKIVVFSGSRADLGLLHTVIQNFADSREWELKLVRVGHSLSHQQDFDSSFDGVDVLSLPTADGTKNIENRFQNGHVIAQILSAVTNFLQKHKTDIAFLAGDRFEILACCLAAYYANIPIAHLHGGDRSTGGHTDDNARHAITKLAHLHFTVCEDSFQRVKRLGEETSRIFNVGSPVVDNVRSIEFIDEVSEPYVVFSYHPLALEPYLAGEEAKKILEALSEHQFKVMITSPNNELGAEQILEVIDTNCTRFPKFKWVGNCGWKTYLNLVKFSRFAIGNSSSLLTEAPILGVPSINVGRRQQGRFAPNSVIQAAAEEQSLAVAIDTAGRMDPTQIGHPYGTGNVGERIRQALETWINDSSLLRKKIVY